jgi:hypothetical protein
MEYTLVPVMLAGRTEVPMADYEGGLEMMKRNTRVLAAFDCSVLWVCLVWTVQSCHSASSRRSTSVHLGYPSVRWSPPLER